MSKKVKIERIVIQVGDKEIPLSMDEARELKEILAEMFGKTVYVPSSPVIIERPYQPYRVYPTWTYTYDSTTNSAVFCSNHTQ